MNPKDTLEGFPLPTTQTKVRSFLGSCNVYRRFVKDFAKIASPLNDLPKKRVCPLILGLRLASSAWPLIPLGNGY